MTIGRTLVIGYGNPLRGDDGVGVIAARRMAVDPRFAGATVLTLHQLTPELAADVADAGLVVFVDAQYGDGAPGTVRVHPVAAAAQSGATSHYVDPAALLALAGGLFGAQPAALAVTVSIDPAGTTAVDSLTPPVAAAVAEVVELVAAYGRAVAHA